MLRSLWTYSVIGISATALACMGCDGGRGDQKPAAHSEDHDHGKHGEGHPEEGPHHGHLIELGKEEYHAELAHDEATKTVTIYLLDAGAKNPIAIADAEIVMNLVANGAPMQVKLPAAPQEGDPAGLASRFSLSDEKVLDALEADKTTGRLNISINGKSYSGEIEHHEHGEHDHK